MGKTALGELASQVENLIRQGRLKTARKRLAVLNHQKISREWSLGLASLARRANMPELGIRILNPIVRPSPKRPKNASSEERAEYAANLTKIGANVEALTLLQSLSGEKLPEVLLFTAYAYIARWDYASSIGVLLRYVNTREVSDYFRLVGKVNLLASLSYEGKFDAAEEIKRELLAEVSERNLSLLYGNTLELSAQLAIGQKNWGDANHYLRLALKALKDGSTLDAFFVRKWQAILTLRLDGTNPRSLLALSAIREEATDRGHWETVRDCDRYEALATKSKSLVLHLYFGTPWPSFRQKLLRDLGNMTVPEKYDWRLSGSGKAPAILDLLAGSYSGKKTPLKVGQAIHRALCVLSSDFYRPLRLPSLFAALYPQEHFSPDYSSDRLHQILRRTRRWLNHLGVPLKIVERESGYTLAAFKGIVIRVGKSEGDTHPLIRKLGGLVSNRSLSAREAARELGLSHRTAIRLLKDACDKGDLDRVGSGSSTRYSFKPQFRYSTATGCKVH